MMSYELHLSYPHRTRL